MLCHINTTWTQLWFSRPVIGAFIAVDSSFVPLGCLLAVSATTNEKPCCWWMLLVHTDLRAVLIVRSTSDQCEGVNSTWSVEHCLVAFLNRVLDCLTCVVTWWKCSIFPPALKCAHQNLTFLHLYIIWSMFALHLFFPLTYIFHFFIFCFSQDWL